MLTGKSTRARILDAAEELMRTIGLARATTKEIARAAGCSEAALYKHFSSKEDLFVQVLKERLPRLNPLLDELNAGGGGGAGADEDAVGATGSTGAARPTGTIGSAEGARAFEGDEADQVAEARVGEPGAERSVRENLLEVVRQAALFYERSVPIAASLYAEPRLKERHYRAMSDMGVGPDMPVRSLAHYLRRERDAGRLRGDADPDAAASLLLGACAHRAFLHDFAVTAGRPTQTVGEFAESLVDTVLRGVVGVRPEG